MAHKLYNNNLNQQKTEEDDKHNNNNNNNHSIMKTNNYCYSYILSFIICSTNNSISALSSSPDSPMSKPKPKSTIIDLQSQHKIVTPSERMRKIASSCEEFGINEFDVYGDYSKSKSSTCKQTNVKLIVIFILHTSRLAVLHI